MLPIARPRYLHPNCYEHQKNWNNYSSANHNNHSNYNNYYPSPNYGPPPLSPLGLKEVLSSYTPGPTIIMIEKKRKPSCFKSLNWGLLFIIVCCIFGFFIVGMSLHSKIVDNTTNLPAEPTLAQKSPSPLPTEYELKMDTNQQMEKNNENLSGYMYDNLNPQMKYFNIIHSLDEDDESFVEVVQSYSFL